jgi:hypothetical protein
LLDAAVTDTDQRLRQQLRTRLRPAPRRLQLVLDKGDTLEISTGDAPASPLAANHQPLDGNTAAPSRGRKDPKVYRDAGR